MSALRLDNALVARGLARSRSHGQDLIRRGFVLVDGRIERKPSRQVGMAHALALSDGAPDYVSRGGEKLAAALDAFGFDCHDASVLDIGASTGGFTQVLLERGAACVYAIDVGRDQLDGQLRDDPRVRSFEGLDARHIGHAAIPARIDAVVSDVSFVSLTKVLGPALERVGPGGWAIALIKPQFEVGRDGIGSDGIVRDPALHEAACRRISDWFEDCSFATAGLIPSPVTGRSGNQEFLIGVQRERDC